MTTAACVRADFGLAVFFDPEALPRTDLGLEGTPWCAFLLIGTQPGRICARPRSCQVPTAQGFETWFSAAATCMLEKASSGLDASVDLLWRPLQACSRMASEAVSMAFHYLGRGGGVQPIYNLALHELTYPKP